MHSQTSILQWIQHFRGSEHVFLHGCCYWFAAMLHEQFGAEIYYAAIAGHIVGRISDTYYDVTGIFTPDVTEQMINWAELQKMDPIWASRIRRCCIDLLDE